MPAALGAGFPLQVCPSGLPDGALARLAGNQAGAGHHHHTHHGQHGHHDNSDDDGGHHAYSAERCPIAHLLAAAVLPVSLIPASPLAPAPPRVAVASRHQATTSLRHYHSRAPPAPAAT